MSKILVVVDMQEGFRYSQTEAILPNIIKLLARFGDSTLFTQFIDMAGSPFEKLLRWKKFQNSQNRQLLAELRSFPKPQNTFTHKGYSLFTSELEAFLAKHHRSTWYLCGIFTDVAIVQTALELFDRDIEVKVIADACASPNDFHYSGIHQAALETIRHAIGSQNVLKTDSIELDFK